MTAKTNKAIILLMPPYGPGSHQLTKNIIFNCKSYNLSVIKCLQAKGSFDSMTLIKLINAINKRQRDWPITVIIDRNFCDSPDYILPNIVLDILSTAGLIKICSYEKNYLDQNSDEIKFHFLEGVESNFLSKSANYVKNLVAFVESKIN